MNLVRESVLREPFYHAKGQNRDVDLRIVGLLRYYGLPKLTNDERQHLDRIAGLLRFGGCWFRPTVFRM